MHQRRKDCTEWKFTVEKVVCDVHLAKWKDRHVQITECVNPRSFDGDAFEGF